MSDAIVIRNLSKHYGDVHAVESVNLRVKRGEIYGFLGLNGAGKTTTIRAMLGMIQPTQGEITVLGRPIRPGQQGPWGQVGHLVESPAAYPDLTVTENLELSRRLYHVPDAARTEQMIDWLGLRPYTRRKAGKLSTGNKQRLSLARALMSDPDLLILDEPSNGLDPAGVVEIRNLLGGLVADRGMTVFMSSHILTEVDRLANRIGIIHEGRLIEELDSAQLAQIRAQRLSVSTRNNPAAMQILSQNGYVAEMLDGNIIVQGEQAVSSPDDIATLLVNAGHAPMHLAVEQENLESYFLRLIGGTHVELS